MRTVLALVALAIAAFALPLMVARAENRILVGFEAAGELASILQALPETVDIESLEQGVKLKLERVECKEFGVGTENELPLRQVSCSIEAKGKGRTQLNHISSLALINTLLGLGIEEAGALGKSLVETGEIECFLESGKALQLTPTCSVEAAWAL